MKTILKTVFWGILLCIGGCSTVSVYDSVDSSGHIDANKFKEALAAGADPNELSAKSIPPLAQFPHPAMLQLLVDSGADVNLYVSEQEVSVLQLAAANSPFPEQIEFLISHGAEVNRQDKDGATPLIYAAVNKNPEVIKVLLKNGADMNLRSANGNTVLIVAAQNNKNPDIISTLVKAGAKVNETGVKGQTPLMFAATFNSETSVLKRLLQLGAKINMKDDDGISAVKFALHNHQYENASALLKAGAKIEIQDILLSSDEKIYNNVEYIKLALKNGEKVNKPMATEERDTPLIWTVCNGHFSNKVVETLLQNGADAYAKDANGYTVFDCDSPEKVSIVRNYLRKKNEQQKQKEQKRLDDELKALESDKLF